MLLYWGTIIKMSAIMGSACQNARASATRLMWLIKSGKKEGFRNDPIIMNPMTINIDPRTMPVLIKNA